jgi:hypothetical protein
MDAIRHGTTPVASVRLARDVVRVTEAADESLRQRGEELQIAGGRFRRSPVGVELASGW